MLHVDDMLFFAFSCVKQVILPFQTSEDILKTCCNTGSGRKTLYFSTISFNMLKVDLQNDYPMPHVTLGIVVVFCFVIT